MRGRLSSVLDRYLLRELLTPFALALALCTFFVVIDRIYHLTNLVITKGVPFHLVLQLLVFMLPSFLAHTLPMALLIAVLLAGGRLAGDLEIVAFKAAGISVLRLLRPVLLAALVVSVTTAVLTLVVNPLANREFQRQLFKILQARAVSGLQERVFNNTFGDVVIYLEDISASQVGLRGLLVSDERDPKLSRIIVAHEGRLLADEENRRFTLRLLDGAVNEADVVPVEAPAGLTEAPPKGGAASAERYRHTAFKVYDMSLSIDSPLKSAPRVDKPENDLTLEELQVKIEELGHDAHGQAPYLAEWHKRLALPLAALVFTLVGFPLAVRSHRGGRSVAFVGSLGILLFYYLTMTSLESTALRQRLPVWVAIWTPNALYLLVGSGLLLATLREWRSPRLTLAWRLLELAARWRPRPRRREVLRRTGEARDSTHIVDRYLLRECLLLMAFGLGVASVLFVVVDLLERLDRFPYRLPGALHDGLPIIMLLATIFLFLTLSRHHELTALKAAGVSLYRVSAPILALGLSVSASAGVVQEMVLPILNERGDEVDRVKIRGQLPRHLQSRQRLWFRSSDSRFYRAELLHPGTNDMYGMTLLELNRDFRLVNRLDARRAHWTPTGWELTDGAFREIGADGRVETVPIVSTVLQLQDSIEPFTEVQKSARAMSYRELRDYVARLEAAGFQSRKYLVDLYAKVSFPLMNVIMVLVAIPFALQAPRGGRLAGIGLAIGIMAGYLVVHNVAVAFARADLLPPVLAAWTANVIFAGLGVSLMLRART